MTREQRIAHARRLAADRAGELAESLAKKRRADMDEIQAMSDAELAEELRHRTRSSDVIYLGPLKTPHEWRRAREAARAFTLDAARRGERVTYNQIKMAAYRETAMLVGWSQFATLCMELNDPTEPVLLSSIVVGTDTGTPGDGFTDYARSRGFDAPVSTLQRQAWDYFRSKL